MFQDLTDEKLIVFITDDTCIADDYCQFMREVILNTSGNN